MPFTDALSSPIYHNNGYVAKVEGLFWGQKALPVKAKYGSMRSLSIVVSNQWQLIANEVDGIVIQVLSEFQKKARIFGMQVPDTIATSVNCRGYGILHLPNLRIVIHCCHLMCKGTMIWQITQIFSAKLSEFAYFSAFSFFKSVTNHKKIELQ